MDQKFGEAFGVDFNYCELFDTGLGTWNKAHAAVSNHASMVNKAHNVSVYVHVHEDSSYGRTNCNLSGHGWENQNNNGRILQVSCDLINFNPSVYFYSTKVS